MNCGSMPSQEADRTDLALMLFLQLFKQLFRLFHRLP